MIYRSPKEQDYHGNVANQPLPGCRNPGGGGTEAGGERLGKTQTQIVHEASSAFLAKVSRPRFESLGSGQDEELSAKDSERWLREHWGHSK